MQDIETFIKWYFGERTRLKRGMFNVIFFLAFIPVLFVKFNEMTEKAVNKSDQYAPVMNMLKSTLEGGGHIDARDVEGVLRRSENTRETTRDLMDEFDFESLGETSAVSSKNDNPSLGDGLNFLIYLVLVPIVMMRLRDLGKWNEQLYIFTGLVYSGVIVDAGKSLLSMSFPLWLSGLAGVISFVLISWLCMAAGKKRRTDVYQSDTYMPGDSPDDPY